MKKYLFVIIILCFLLCEIVLEILPNVGFLLYVVLIFAAFLSISKFKNSEDARLVSVMLILPTVRIVSVFLNFGFLINLTIFYSALFLLVLIYQFRLKISVGYNLNKSWLLLAAVLIGAGLGFLGNYAFGIEKHIEIIALASLIAFSEESLFRSLIQNCIKELYSPWIAVFSSAFIYLIFNISQGIYVALFLFLVGLISAIMYQYSKNIFPSILLNLTVTVLLFVL